MERKPMHRTDRTRGSAAVGRGSGSALDELLRRERAKPGAGPAPAAAPRRTETPQPRRDEAAKSGEPGERQPGRTRGSRGADK